MQPKRNKSNSSLLARGRRMDNDRVETGDRESPFPAESTPLLFAPSPNSTEFPSWNNFGRRPEVGGTVTDDMLVPVLTIPKPINMGDEKEEEEEEEEEEVIEQIHRRIHRSSIIVWAFAAMAYVAIYYLWKEDALFGLVAPEVDRDYLACQKPFSVLDPVQDLGLTSYDRPVDSKPSTNIIAPLAATGPTTKRAIPTNAWYQNLILVEGKPTSLHRAYTIPYIVDAAGPIPGLRVHPTHIGASTNVVQVNVVEAHAITIGSSTSHPVSIPPNFEYNIREMTQLAVTLGWDDYEMSAPIVKGMPYVTMRYESVQTQTPTGTVVYPTIAFDIPINNPLVIDDEREMECGEDVPRIWVESEIAVYNRASDFTWLVFVSEPVYIKCDSSGTFSRIRVVSSPRLRQEVKPFFFRVALFKPCTNGFNPVYCHLEQMHPTALHMGQGDYGDVLRAHSHVFPGSSAAVSYSFPSRAETHAELHFDWDPQVTHQTFSNETVDEVLMFALPHHFDMAGRNFESPSIDLYCAHSTVGPACLVAGSRWVLSETMPPISFAAARPPAYWALDGIAKSLEEDLKYTLPDFFQRGAGDTYFSGKMLAKLGRILMIAQELREICRKGVLRGEEQDLALAYATACSDISTPTNTQMMRALSSLRSSVEVWINGTAEAPFVYDSAWGGVVSCGCLFDHGHCSNTFPDCPAFSDPGLNFGNAFYNDMHFHYGYHIFAAAVVSHFDRTWGKAYFERVLLLVRNIANPSAEDEHFPVMRHKDVYQGHSWASGIARPTYLNGRNQESSSESLAAYESVALYGQVMASIFRSNGSQSEYNAAVEVRRVGKLMTASEMRSARKYYHVKKDETVKIFPSTYTPHVVGIMWQTLAQFQTWFGNAPYLAYGIQLLPMTPIAESRDSVPWLKEMYTSFADSCEANDACEEQGWSILQLGALATVGHPAMAFAKAESLPVEVFNSAGGNGQSMTNTLWYIATRASVEEPLPLTEEEYEPHTPKPIPNVDNDYVLTDCFRPDTCDEYVLDTIVMLYSCRQRIQFIIRQFGKTEREACIQVGGIEFPDECGGCNPLSKPTDQERKSTKPKTCPPCSEKACHSDLNRCPAYEKTFVCTEGPSVGGCSGNPWDLDGTICEECCELTHCPNVSPSDLTVVTNEGQEEDCPVCPPEVCDHSTKPGNQCQENVSPYLCTEGASVGGCSMHPWSVRNGDCSSCCKVVPGCDKK